MAIQSLNTLQNKDNYNQVAEEYILESLANLGQRYSVQGDSIAIGNFSIGSLFQNTNSDYLVIVQKQEESDNYEIYLADKNLSPVDNPIPVNINSVKIDDFNFSVSDFYYSFYGVLEEGEEEVNERNLINELFNRNSGKLINGTRIFKSHFSNIYENKYLLVKARLNNEGNYVISLYFSYLDEDNITDTELYEYINNQELIDDAFDLLYEYTCEYDNANQVILPTNEMEDQFTHNDYEFLENTVLGSFNDDIQNLLPSLTSEYSNNEYGSVESIYEKILVKLYNCIKAADGNDSDEFKLYIPILDKDGNSYTITYAYNKNKPEEVYFAGKEIVVSYVHDDIVSAWMNEYLDDYRGTIIANSITCNRTAFFYFESELDENTGEIVDIDVKKISTLPYINDNDYWVINDVPTTIMARGKNAGNPNIIIVETKPDSSNNICNILAGAKKAEVLDRLDWEYAIAKVEPLEKINLDTNSSATEFDYLSVKCAIPNLGSEVSDINREDYLEFLQNSIIICISPISCVDFTNTVSNDDINYTEEKVKEIYGEYGVITTIWHYDENTESYEYLRKLDNQYSAADFNYISNINNLIQYAVKNVEPLHPDNFEFTYLVFDRINVSLKNNPNDEPTYLFPNLINKLSSEYSNAQNYNNDLNFTFKYNDLVERNSSEQNIESVSQSGSTKYFRPSDAESENVNAVTNDLYTYDGTGNATHYNEYIPNYQVPSLDLSEVLTRNETLLNRLNILTFDSAGTTYLSYVGTSYEMDKNIFTIGTSYTNINLGTETLINTTDRSSFTKQDVISIDFPEAYINGNTYVSGDLSVDKDIYLNNSVWTKDYNTIVETENSQEVSTELTHYTTIYTPVSRYIYELSDHFGNNDAYGTISLVTLDAMDYIDIQQNNNQQESNEDENNQENNVQDYVNWIGTDITNMETLLVGLLNEDLYEYSYLHNKLYIISTIVEYYNTESRELTNEGVTMEITSNQTSEMIYFSDGIYIPTLLYQLGLSDYVINDENTNNISLPNVEVTSNMDIIKINGNPIILLTSSTNLYPDNYIYTEDSQQIKDFTNKMFTGNSLKITYYKQSDKLYIHIEELFAKNKYSINKQIKKEYTI